MIKRIVLYSILVVNAVLLKIEAKINEFYSLPVFNLVLVDRVI